MNEDPARLPTLENARIAIIGLGYVGLPLAVEFGKKLSVVGFDIKPQRIAELKREVEGTGAPAAVRKELKPR